MTWYFNFCGPAIPNDATINFHRGFQTAELMTMLILFVLYYTYYKLWGPDPLSETKDQNASNENESKKDSEQDKSEKSNSDEKSVKDEEKSENQENKSVSIAQKIKNFGEENESYVSFKTSKSKANKSSGEKFLKKNKPATNAPKTSKALSIKENVSAQEIESYFPIVFGHHAIAMGASIMYSPYAEQSIASILYVLFTFILAMVNSKRMRKTTFGVWIFMAFLNVFIMMSALLEVGQSNWDFVNNVCFAEEYVSLY